MRRFAPLVLLCFVLGTIGGCASEYQANMDARKQIAWTDSVNKRLSTEKIMTVINKVLAPFENEHESKVKLELAQFQPKTVTNEVYAMGLMASVMCEMIAWNGKAELMRARAQAIQYLTPLIQSIYANHMADFGTPMSTTELLGKVVAQIPFVATVGGMYALGAKGIENAGTSLAGTFSGNTTIGDGNATGLDNARNAMANGSASGDTVDGSRDSASEGSSSGTTTIAPAVETTTE